MLWEYGDMWRGTVVVYDCGAVLVWRYGGVLLSWRGDVVVWDWSGVVGCDCGAVIVLSYGCVGDVVLWL